MPETTNLSQFRKDLQCCSDVTFRSHVAKKQESGPRGSLSQTLCSQKPAQPGWRRNVQSRYTRTRGSDWVLSNGDVSRSLAICHDPPGIEGTKRKTKGCNSWQGLTVTALPKCTSCPFPFQGAWGRECTRLNVLTHFHIGFLYHPVGSNDDSGSDSHRWQHIPTALYFLCIQGREDPPAVISRA